MIRGTNGKMSFPPPISCRLASGGGLYSTVTSCPWRAARLASHVCYCYFNHAGSLHLGRPGILVCGPELNAVSPCVLWIPGVLERLASELGSLLKLLDHETVSQATADKMASVRNLLDSLPLPGRRIRRRGPEAIAAQAGSRRRRRLGAEPAARGREACFCGEGGGMSGRIKGLG